MTANMLLTLLLITCLASASSIMVGREDAEIDKIVRSLSAPGVSFRRAPVLTSTPPGRRTGSYMGLTRIAARSAVRHSAASLLVGRQMDAVHGGLSNVSVVDHTANQYYVNVLLNGAPTKLLLDSSSSDTWVRSINFTCLGLGRDNRTSSTCDLGPAWPNTNFPEGPRQDLHFYIGYPNNDTMAGRLGLLDVDVAGITVRRQEIGLAAQGTWTGNNVTSGVLGMAYPSLTSAYLGDDLTSHDEQDSVTYSPLFTSMVANDSIEPYWVLAICRNSTEGMLSIGSMPPVDRRDSHSAQTFLVITDIAHKGTTGYLPSYYTVIPSAVVLERVKNYSRYPYIIDSSTSSILVPPDVAELVNQKFNPPAIFLWYYGAWFVDCDAIAPRFAIEIEGTSFFINPMDMVNRELKDPLTGLCASTIGSGENGPFVLGLPFLTNVMVSFDVGASTVSFWSREFY